MNVTVKDLSASVSAISQADIDRTLLSFKVAKETGECTDVEVGEINSYCKLLTNFRRAVSFADVRNAYDAIKVAFAKIASAKIQSFIVRSVAEKFLEIVEDKFTAIRNRRPAIEVKNADNRTYDLLDRRNEILLTVRLKIRSEEVCPPIENLEIVFNWQSQEIRRRWSGKFDVGDEIVVDALQIPISVLELETGRGVIKTMASYEGYDGEHINVVTDAVSFALAYIPVEDVYRKWIDKPADSAMFVGRKMLLNDMVKAVGTAKGGLGFPIRGQRRQGKSSLMEAFSRRLPCDDVEITALNFMGIEKDIGKDYKDLVDMFVKQVAADLSIGKSLLSHDWEKQERYVGKSARELIRLFAQIIPRGKTWCISIDEFTVVYDYYLGNEKNIGNKEERRAELKSLLELLKTFVDGKVFHLFVFVQNSFFEFRHDFADLVAALGKEVMLEGLDEDDVTALVAKMDPRFLRIKQPEVAKLRTLSGGNPLFLLHLLSMISHEKVGAMKTMSSFMITEPVINHAVSLLCDRKKHKEQCLQPMDFQCMFKLGIANLEDEEDVLRVYRLLSAKDGCEEVFTQKDSKILLALQDRGIVKPAVEGGRYEIVIGLFREWLNRYDKDSQLSSEDFLRVE